MALNDKRVVTASTGFVYTGSAGLAYPTPTAIADFDPNKFGCKAYDVEVTATTGTYKLSVASVQSGDIPFDADAGTIQNALEAIASVGVGNVLVEDGATAGEFVVTFTGLLQGVDVALTAATGATVTVKTALNGWSQVGHTSREEMPEFGFDGGDTEIRGTWQNAALREQQTETPADYLLLNINQLDRTSFGFYYGESSTPNVPGVFGVSGNAVNKEGSLLVVIQDGDVKLGFGAMKASFRREDAINMPVDEFMYLPVRATFLKQGANDLYRWISEDLFD